ncbi:hypothetical protein [Flaviflagellibacter deserti]|uniref:Abi-like protein n=1 Tax=Flaviflagellibacter deserti TaxID=2267266 RepID=A0ABV9Z7R1_9HYPH
MFTTEELDTLPLVLSPPRFATYLKAKDGMTAEALALYQWNLKVSAAFMLPLHVCEVAMRNAVVQAIEKVHGENWPWARGFRRSLRRTRRGYCPVRDLEAVAAKEPTAGKVVADLKFAFWQWMFLASQDERLWEPHLHEVFPGISTNTQASIAREAAYSELYHVRFFRNRIAHHEPIFGRRLGEDYARIIQLIEWRSPVAATWVGRVQRVEALLGQVP